MKHTYCFYTDTAEHLMLNADVIKETETEIILYREIPPAAGEDVLPFPDIERKAALYKQHLIGFEIIR